MEELIGALLPALNAAGLLGAIAMAIMWLEGRGRISRLEARNEAKEEKLSSLQIETVKAIHDQADAFREVSQTFETLYNNGQLGRGRK